MEEKTVYYISEAAKKVQVESHVLRYWEDELELPILRNEMGHRCYTEQDIRKLQEIKQLKEQGLQLKAIRTILFRMPGSIGEKAEDIFGQPDRTLQPIQQPIEQPLQQAVQENERNKAAVPENERDKVPAPENEGDKAVTPENERDKAAIPENERSKNAVSETGPDRNTKQEKTQKTENGAETITEYREGAGKDMTEYRASADTEQIDINKPQRFIVALSKEKEETETMAQEAQFDEEDRSRKAARLQYLLQHMITEAVRSANRELCTDVKESIIKELDYQFRMQEERDEERWKKEEEHYRRIDEMIRERHRPKERLGRGKKKSPVADDPVNL